MSLISSRHIYPTSFGASLNNSLSKLQGTPIKFLVSYNLSPSSRCNRRLSCWTKNNTFCSASFENPNPRRIPRDSDNKWRKPSGKIPTPSPESTANSSGSGNWLEKWNQPRPQSRPKPAQEAVSYRNVGGGTSAGNGRTGGGRGDGGGSTMEKIVEKLRRFGYDDDNDEVGNRDGRAERRIEKSSVEDIFYVEDGILPNGRGGVSEDSPLGMKKVVGGNSGIQFPWEERASIEDEAVKNSVRKSYRKSVAQLTLPESELRRLKYLSMRAKGKVKIGGAGITKAIVDTIHEKWRDSEVVKLKIEGAPALNMKKIHEILERKTGGLVIWRSGTSVALYRGVSYKDPAVEFKKQILKKNEDFRKNKPSISVSASTHDQSKLSSHEIVHSPEKSFQRETDNMEDSETLQEVIYEDEMDEFLGDLGPRYTDWPGEDPLPVDADMLPTVVPGYELPYRLLPYGVRATLSIKEATSLRRIARALPPHFALGRSRQLVGLAVAMVKLWERSSIAKVALKRGVPITTSERMAEDIKRLTGGTILSRNKDFLVFYRGKDFLSMDVAKLLLERERLAKTLQDEEEKARLHASVWDVLPGEETKKEVIAAGTLDETRNADARWGKKLDEKDIENTRREAEVLRHTDLVRKLERKLSLAEKKLLKAETALAKVEDFLRPSETQADPNSITDEERFMFRKLGLRMKAFLLLGKRGVFDGTVENMHLHWKYRELVKIIVKAKTFEEVKEIALSLEAESRGVLVSVDKVSKGYAVIVFRGKDYHRPSHLRPKNLLTKRKALARSIELQRREAFLKHIAIMQRNVAKLRSEIDQMETMKGNVDSEFYDSLDSAYPSEDEESEEEGDEEQFDVYDNTSDDEDASNDHNQTFHLQAHSG